MVSMVAILSPKAVKEHLATSPILIILLYKIHLTAVFQTVLGLCATKDQAEIRLKALGFLAVHISQV